MTGECSTEYDHLCLPVAVAFDPAGNIYVADSGNQRVQKYNSNLDWLMTIGTGDYGNQFDQFAGTNGIEVDAQGKIYVSEWGNQRVQVFDPNWCLPDNHRGILGDKFSPIYWHQQYCPGSKGNVYVGDAGITASKNTLPVCLAGSR